MRSVARRSEVGLGIAVSHPLDDFADLGIDRLDLRLALRRGRQLLFLDVGVHYRKVAGLLVDLRRLDCPESRGLALGAPAALRQLLELRKIVLVQRPCLAQAHALEVELIVVDRPLRLLALAEEQDNRVHARGKHLLRKVQHPFQFTPREQHVRTVKFS